MPERAEAALARARAVDPEATGPKENPPVGEGDPESLFTSKVLHIRGDTSRAYVGLAKWCRGKKLLFEARRAVGKALTWDRRNSEAIGLTHNRKLKGDLLYAALRRKEKGIWKKGRWVPEGVFRKNGKKRIGKILEMNRKKYGLAFEGDFLPNLDILYTVEEVALRETKEAVSRYLDHVRGRFFLADPKRPFLFYFLRNAEEFKKVGQNPAQGGAYVWGRGALYVYPGAMGTGTGTVLHELTHAFQEASFSGFPPLWMNEGLACFFETYSDLADERPFGVVNWRDQYYARAVREGKARPLERLVSDFGLSIDMMGYAQGRALMMFLWSRGELEAFVISAQLFEPQKTYRRPKEIGRAFGAILAKVVRKSIPDLGAELEEFARGLKKTGQRFERGVRADEAIDDCLGSGPPPE
jgi:hypothetical protein